MEKCIRCGETGCKNIGKKNRFGEKKEYCCSCYQSTQHQRKHNPDFNRGNYCFFCHAVTWQEAIK